MSGMRLGVITDELDDNLDRALDACERLQIADVELRTVGGTNLANLDDERLLSAIADVHARGCRVNVLASPVFKCHLPNTQPNTRSGAVHGAAAAGSLDENWRLLDRLLAVAERCGIPFVRVFSFWRVAAPQAALDPIADLLSEAVRRAESYAVELLLENEHDCNVATAAETAALLHRVDGLRLIWDPGNHLRAGGGVVDAVGDGFGPRIAHVHMKDIDSRDNWVVLGTGRLPLRSIVNRLQDMGYRGVLSLETHCRVEGSVSRATELSLAALKASLEPSS